jgi:transcriptional pleiotropic regulator of transition state genes
MNQCIRTLDELGRIVIPRSIRAWMHITNHTPLEICLKDNKIIIAKLKQSCALCGINKNLIKLNETTNICTKCLNDCMELNTQEGEINGN